MDCDVMDFLGNLFVDTVRTIEVEVERMIEVEVVQPDAVSGCGNRPELENRPPGLRPVALRRVGPIHWTSGTLGPPMGNQGLYEGGKIGKGDWRKMASYGNPM